MLNEDNFCHITQDLLVEHVRERWARQYALDKNSPMTDKKEIWKRLEGVTSKDEIDKIIGNKSWTDISCEICKAQDLKKAVIFKGYDEWIHVCESCLEKSLKFIKEK